MSAGSECHMGFHDSQITLNVGGRVFHTTRSTLLGAATDRTFFTGLLSGRFREGEMCGLFIDRDGDIFVHVLDYLRYGELFRELDTDTWRKLRVDAMFYGISGLADLADATIASQRRPVSLSLYVFGMFEKKAFVKKDAWCTVAKNSADAAYFLVVNDYIDKFPGAAVIIKKSGIYRVGVATDLIESPSPSDPQDYKIAVTNQDEDVVLLEVKPGLTGRLEHAVETTLMAGSNLRTEVEIVPRSILTPTSLPFKRIHYNVSVTLQQELVSSWQS